MKGKTPEGYEDATPLPIPKAYFAADQVRELGLWQGDEIIGSEVADDGAWWEEVNLRLVCVGEEIAVWKVSRRNKPWPSWQKCGESANWTLNGRLWYRVKAQEAGDNDSGEAAA